jgi:DNA-binding transcriptional regulator YhcF (GntR family)
MARAWTINSYKEQLDLAIATEQWGKADRARVAVKRRLLEMMSKGGSEQQFADARDALADSYKILKLSKRVNAEKGAVSMALSLLADAETAGIAAEQAPAPQNIARDVKERILQLLSSGNRRPWSTGELAKEAERSIETISRAVSQLRAERKILSRRNGRYMLHRLADVQTNTMSKLMNVTAKVPVKKIEQNVARKMHWERRSGVKVCVGTGERAAEYSNRELMLCKRQPHYHSILNNENSSPGVTPAEADASEEQALRLKAGKLRKQQVASKW